MKIYNKKIKVWHIEWNNIRDAQFVYNYIQEYEDEPNVFTICEPECCGRYISLWTAIKEILKKN